MNRMLRTSVPRANFSNSKTPIGPFQMTVLVVSKASLNVLIESGPMSNPIQPSGMPVAGTVWTKEIKLSYSIISMNSKLAYSLEKQICKLTGLDFGYTTAKITNSKHFPTICGKTNLGVRIRSKFVSHDNISG